MRISQQNVLFCIIMKQFDPIGTEVFSESSSSFYMFSSF